MALLSRFKIGVAFHTGLAPSSMDITESYDKPVPGPSHTSQISRTPVNANKCKYRTNYLKISNILL